MNNQKLTPLVNKAEGDSAESGDNFFKNLLNTVGTGGIKTDVSITLAPKNFIWLGLAVFIAVVAVWVVTKISEELFFKK